MNDWKFLELYEDEAEHNRRVSEQIQWHLDLAEDAALLTLNGLWLAHDRLNINEPKGIVLLLMVKTAQNIRFAISGLRLGYYSGSRAVLRSALDALSYAALFASDPNQVAIWLRNEPPQQGQDIRRKDRDNQLKLAKQALLDWAEDRHGTKDTTYEFRKQANKQIHPTVEGLAEEFGFDTKSFLPDDFEEAYFKAGEDLDKALGLYALLSKSKSDANVSRRRRRKIETEQEEIEKVEMEFNGRYHEPTLSNLARFAFYIGNSLLDLTKAEFSISDGDFNGKYKSWHSSVREHLTPNE